LRIGRGVDHRAGPVGQQGLQRIQDGAGVGGVGEGQQQHVVRRQVGRQGPVRRGIGIQEIDVLAVLEQAVHRRVLRQVARRKQHQQSQPGRLLLRRQGVDALLLQRLLLHGQAQLPFADGEEGGGQVHPQGRVVLVLARLVEQRLGDLAQVGAVDAQAQERRKAEKSFSVREGMGSGRRGGSPAIGGDRLSALATALTTAGAGLFRLD
jgi:hypothetical protein